MKLKIELMYTAERAREKLTRRKEMEDRLEAWEVF
jgi:hypothetical protein